jgi:hypothetical protein
MIASVVQPSGPGLEERRHHSEKKRVVLRNLWKSIASPGLISALLLTLVCLYHTRFVYVLEHMPVCSLYARLFDGPRRPRFFSQSVLSSEPI